MSDFINYSETSENGMKIPFFKKPGSVTGTVLLVLGGIFALIHINPILAFLNSLMANTLTFIGLCCALAAVFYCILDPKIRRIVSELYFMLVRKVMGRPQLINKIVKKFKKYLKILILFNFT